MAYGRKWEGPEETVHGEGDAVGKNTVPSPEPLTLGVTASVWTQ